MDTTKNLLSLILEWKVPEADLPKFFELYLFLNESILLNPNFTQSGQMASFTNVINRLIFHRNAISLAQAMKCMKVTAVISPDSHSKILVELFNKLSTAFVEIAFLEYEMILYKDAASFHQLTECIISHPMLMRPTTNEWQKASAKICTHVYHELFKLREKVLKGEVVISPSIDLVREMRLFISKTLSNNCYDGHHKELLEIFSLQIPLMIERATPSQNHKERADLRGFFTRIIIEISPENFHLWGNYIPILTKMMALKDDTLLDTICTTLFAICEEGCFDNEYDHYQELVKILMTQMLEKLKKQDCNNTSAKGIFSLIIQNGKQKPSLEMRKLQVQNILEWVTQLRSLNTSNSRLAIQGIGIDILSNKALFHGLLEELKQLQQLLS